MILLCIILRHPETEGCLRLGPLRAKETICEVVLGNISVRVGKCVRKGSV